MGCSRGDTRSSALLLLLLLRLAESHLLLLSPSLSFFFVACRCTCFLRPAELPGGNQKDEQTNKCTAKKKKRKEKHKGRKGGAASNPKRPPHPLSTRPAVMQDASPAPGCSRAALAFSLWPWHVPSPPRLRPRRILHVPRPELVGFTCLFASFFIHSVPSSCARSMRVGAP